MRKATLISAIAVALVLFASFGYAQEIVIDDAYTMNHMMEPATEFEAWDPVMYHVDYTITGNAGTTYIVKVIIKSMGDRIVLTEKHLPGSYTTVTTNLARDDDVGTHTVIYKVKLRKGGLLDIDTDSSEITVSE